MWKTHDNECSGFDRNVNDEHKPTQNKFIADEYI